MPVTIIAVALSKNLVAALARAPHLATRCRLVGVFDSFAVGYSGGALASAETNFREGPAVPRRHGRALARRASHPA